MKRILLHAAFWIAYLLIFAWNGFLWDRAASPRFSDSQLITINIQTAFLHLIPQILFAYYLVYFAIPEFVKGKIKLIYSLCIFIAVIGVCAVMDRSITNYIILPYFYNDYVGAKPLLDPKRIFIVILFFSFSSGVILIIKLVRTQLAAKEKEKVLIKQKLETELLFLRNQINPHFLMNTLNNIFALARKKSDDTPEVVMRLSELMRFVLYESNGEFIKLNEEIGLLEDYIALETIRYNERLSINFEKNIDSDGYNITPMLLLPLIENAFKHGVSETRFESYIFISLQVRNGYLQLLVENTSEPANSATPAASIGLKNVKRQLELTYHDYRLNYQQRENIFRVDLFVNLNSHVKI